MLALYEEEAEERDDDDRESNRETELVGHEARCDQDWQTHHDRMQSQHVEITCERGDASSADSSERHENQPRLALESPDHDEHRATEPPHDG